MGLDLASCGVGGSALAVADLCCKFALADVPLAVVWCAAYDEFVGDYECAAVRSVCSVCECFSSA